MLCPKCNNKLSIGVGFSAQAACSMCEFKMEPKCFRQDTLNGEPYYTNEKLNFKKTFERLNDGTINWDDL